MNSGLPDSASGSGLQLWLLVREQSAGFRTITRKAQSGCGAVLAVWVEFVLDVADSLTPVAALQVRLMVIGGIEPINGWSGIGSRSFGRFDRRCRGLCVFDAGHW